MKRIGFFVSINSSAQTIEEGKNKEDPMKTNFLLILFVLFQHSLTAQQNIQVTIGPDNEPVAPGKFEPTWPIIYLFGLIRTV